MHQRRAVQPAEALRDAAVDVLVIERRRRPARAADDAQLAQPEPPSPLLAVESARVYCPATRGVATSGKRTDLPRN